MKRTIEVFNYSKFISGERFGRATVEPFFKVWDTKLKRERTVWKETEDESCQYILEHGLLWPYDGPDGRFFR